LLGQSLGCRRFCAGVGEFVGGERRSQRCVDAERVECLLVGLVECEADQTQSVGAQSRAVASVEGREFRGEEDGVGVAALGEDEQLGRVGGAADHRDRVLASEQLVFDLALGERRQA